MKVKIKTTVATVVLAGVLTSAITFGVTKLKSNSEEVKNNSTEVASSTTSNEKTDKDSKTDVDKQGIIDMLSEQGIDKDKLEEEYKTSNGATILGDAKPAMQYRSLHDAESAFGYYLGLHNQLESLTEYKLVDMHIINNEFMQGNFESNDEKKTIVVKTSKKLTNQELAKVYKEHNYDSSISIKGVSVDIAGESQDKINMASFKVPNGKSYVINTVAGLSSDDMNKLLNELIGNLQIMNDWID